jgi:uncharacterized membrane protein
MRTFLVVLHVLGVIFWVGGMGFSQMVLRPALASLDGPTRVGIMMRVLAKFFRIVIVSLLAIWVSGLAILLPVGMRFAPLSWHLMYGLATLATIVFVVAYGLYRGKAIPAYAANDIKTTADVLGKIRILISVNLVLTTLAAVAGLYRG